MANTYGGLILIGGIEVLISDLKRVELASATGLNPG